MESELHHGHGQRIGGHVPPPRRGAENYVDLLALLCDHNRRVSLFTQGGKPITKDSRHSLRKAQLVGQLTFSQSLWRRMVKAAADSAAGRAKELVVSIQRVWRPEWSGRRACSA
jgi:hypothetical protein